MATDDKGKKTSTVRKACLRVTADDYKRLVILRTNEDLTWDGLLSQAVNLWLAERGKKELSSL